MPSERTRRSGRDPRWLSHLRIERTLDRSRAASYERPRRPETTTVEDDIGWPPGWARGRSPIRIRQDRLGRTKSWCQVRLDRCVTIWLHVTIWFQK
jgi:hypothetical protein